MALGDIENILKARLGTTGTITLVNTALVDSNGNEAIAVNTTASAVNHVAITNAAASGSPILIAAGDDTNVSLKLQSKGSGVVAAEDHLLELSTVATISTAGAGTYSAANLLGGYILRDPAGGNRTDTTATAAQIVAAVPGASAGLARLVIVKNTADAAETITVAGGSGVTVTGTATIAQNATRIFLMRLDNVGSGTEAVTLYSIMSGSH